MEKTKQRDHAITDQKQAFSTLDQYIPMSRHLVDEEFSLIWTNDALLTLVDRIEDVHDYHQFFHALWREETGIAFQKHVQQAIERSIDAVDGTFYIHCKDGTKRWFQIKSILEGKHQFLTLVYIELTTGMHIQESAQSNFQNHSEEFIWMMDEYAGNVYMSDMDTYELLYVNPTTCENLQKSPSQVLGRKCYEVIQGRTTPCPFCTNAYLKRHETYEWEFYNPTLERTFLIKNRRIDWHERNVRVELSHDIYSMEYKLVKKDQEREAIVKTIPGGLARLDARDMKTTLWYNGRFLDLIGYTAKQFEEELQCQSAYVHPDDLERIYRACEQLKETGQNTVLEERILTRDGIEKILTITLCFIDGKDSWDGIPSYYSLGLDITKERSEQEHQRKALEDAYESARIANGAKTNFLTSMSHDIRTPMNAIMGMTAIAQVHIQSPDKVRDCLDKITSSSRHLLSLVDEVLDMSKIESGKIDLMPEHIELSSLIQDISDMCLPLINEKHQEFRIHINGVHHEHIIADRERLQQIFTNLLSNAIKYTPEYGTILLSIQELASFKPGTGRFKFVIEDNGIGMLEGYIPHVFEPFSRAEDHRVSNIQGTGLGMAITENIVHMMNGTIEVLSEAGSGSTFIITIPLQLHLGEEVREEELVGQSVLVVDDDPIVCESTVMLLNELGMRGCAVLSGKDAIEYAVHAHQAQDDYFAIILDWKMPDMDGLETIKVLRKALGNEVPIIIISAYDYANIEEAFLKAGADAFIAKPLFKSRMQHVLSLFCSNRSFDKKETEPDLKHVDLRGKRILLAEDNELNQEIAMELLSMKGILVDAADNGLEALTMFENSEIGMYDAVLMDIQMPIMDGYASTRAIRALKREDAQSIPIIALTANAFISDVVKTQTAGMNEHIAKPIDIEHLLELLQQYLVPLEPQIVSSVSGKMN